MRDFLLTTTDREDYLYSILELIECKEDYAYSASRPSVYLSGVEGSQSSFLNGLLGDDVN